ncbi:protein lin-28 homolog B-like [Callorhinchus milii]|uniref:protein lin-28 homolog B-like n=1 Tax=Callorhinchus milii TaxID=7868 RepID=UPI001C3F7FEF|nr:protein lin-28 homolog B-like [Callorhinchus milii]
MCKKCPLFFLVKLSLRVNFQILQKMMRSLKIVSCPDSGGASKGGGDERGKLAEREEESQIQQGAGHCKWFNVRMGFGFISMTSREGSPLETPVDVFVHQSKLYMEGFRSLKEGEPVEFTFKKSSKGLESIRVTGPGGAPCLGSERRPKGKTVQKRKPKGDRIQAVIPGRDISTVEMSKINVMYIKGNVEGDSPIIGKRTDSDGIQTNTMPVQHLPAFLALKNAIANKYWYQNCNYS